MSFNSKEVRLLCEDDQAAMQKLGESISLKLQSRLADMAAAKTVNELVVGNPKPLDGDADCYTISLGDDCVMFFCSSHVNPKVDENNFTNWSKVTRVKILRIETEHECIN